MAIFARQILITERLIVSNYANYPQNIYDRIRTLILADYPQVHISNRRIFDEDGKVISDALGKHNRGIGFWLINDDFDGEGANANDRIYPFEVEVAVKDIDEDQNQIMDMVERIKFACEDNKHDSSNNWYRNEVSSVEYFDPDPNEPNIKKAIMLIRFWREYVIDTS